MQGSAAFDLHAIEAPDPHGLCNGRIAFLLPTTHLHLQSGAYSTIDLAIGIESGKGLASVHDGLRIIHDEAPSRVVVHSDQLVEPPVANILVLLDEFEGYISSIEYLLNSKYAYTLKVWLGGSWLTLPPRTSLQEVARAVVAHLQACLSLGDNWIMAGLQRRRMRRVRDSICDRKLRFVRSSIAAAFASAPDAEVAVGYHADLACFAVRNAAGARA